MSTLDKIAKKLTTLLGLGSIFGLFTSFFILERLRPKMIRFLPISPTEESLINVFGLGLLTFLAFCLLIFYQLVKNLQNVKKIKFLHLFLFATLIFSFLSIFSDLALISDIGKQYKLDLGQPEWWILYPMMLGQLTATLILTWANHFKLGTEKQLKHIAKDSNIFILAQYIGLICGLLGLALTSLSFWFPRPLWMIKIHTLSTAVFLLVPYCLIVGCWFLVKIREKGSWYDEKQLLDIGRSSFLTVVVSSAVMMLVYFLNYPQTEGILSVLWLPFYLFLVLFLFSLGNLYYIQKG